MTMIHQTSVSALGQKGRNVRWSRAVSPPHWSRLTWRDRQTDRQTQDRRIMLAAMDPAGVIIYWSVFCVQVYLPVTARRRGGRRHLSDAPISCIAAADLLWDKVILIPTLSDWPRHRYWPTAWRVCTLGESRQRRGGAAGACTDCEQLTRTVDGLRGSLWSPVELSYTCLVSRWIYILTSVKFA